MASSTSNLLSHTGDRLRDLIAMADQGLSNPRRDREFLLLDLLRGLDELACQLDTLDSLDAPEFVRGGDVR